MQIIKLAQNAQYLQNIGVAPQNINTLLQYLLSLDGDERKQAVRRVRQNPEISIDDLKQPVDKESFLKQQNVPDDVIKFAKSISEKYSVWIAREIMNWLKSVNKWNSQNEQDKNTYERDPITNYHLRDISSPRPLLFPLRWIPLIDWAEANSPDIMKMSLTEVQQQSEKWHKELAETEEDELLTYKTNNVVYKFPNGWNIVKLSGDDCTTEGKMMGHCVKGYGKIVDEGNTQIYSLRDKKNRPHVTMEVYIPPSQKEISKSPTLKKLHDTDPNRYNKISIQQIQGKGNEEPIDEYKLYVKQWFDSLKQQGYQFEPVNLDYEEEIDVTNFHDFKNKQDDYGVPITFSGIGGTAYTWGKNLESAYDVGVDRSGNFHEGETIKIFDQLIQYAFEQNETDQFEHALSDFSDWANGRFEEWNFSNEDDIVYPNEQDFTSYYENDNNQPEFESEGFEDTKKEVFDQEGYNKAVQQYESQIAELEKDFPPTRMSSYLFTEFNKKMQEVQQDNNKAAKTGTNMIKTADKKVPSAEDIAAYVEALNIYLENDKIKDKHIATLVKRLPYPDSIRAGFSNEECKLVFQSVNYAWKEITGQDLMQEEQIDRAPKGLEGNYWMMTNGVILSGTNHFTIIKQNLNLFSTLLNISPFVLHEKLASPPDEIIKTVIDNGGMRIFITVDKKGYFQLSDETYSKWGRNKVKGLDIKDKIVKVVDRQTPYKGWKSGITILL